MKNVSGASGCAALMLLPLLAWADPPPALVPRAPTGYSTLEQRYVYAPPDEGEFQIQLRTGGAAPREYVIAEPSMCAGSATVTIQYSKSKNRVRLIADLHGLPYRMNATRPDDLSNAYNQFPTSVQDGKWQIWFVGRQFSFKSKFYYDLNGKLLGNEMDLPTPPAGAQVFPINTLHMVSTPIFEGDRAGNAHVVFDFKYDRMLDGDGTGGVWFGYVPFDLCKPDEYGPYYTQGGLPAAKALDFDQVLDGIHNGFGMAIAMSLEPDPKPAYLLARDNPMIGWSGLYPLQVPEGLVIEPVTGTFGIAPQCGSRLSRSYAKGFYNLCSGK